MNEQKVKFTRDKSLNGTFYKKDQEETFAKSYAEALEAKGIVKKVVVQTTTKKPQGGK